MRVLSVRRATFVGWLLALAVSSAAAEQPQTDSATTRNGREIYASFRAGLADPHCDTESSPRWRGHFANAPRRLASADNDLLPLFGYVVDALRAANLPTEFALIPFVESGYKPGARSASGPAGLWQMIAITARDHHVPMRRGYDGRLSPVDSTQAAVRYLKTLHGMFAGDWRLAVMAYNAGEYRVFGALRRSGQVARNADPEALLELSGISQAYVRKLHALSCLFDQADDRDSWMQALDRPVPVLQVITLPAGTRTLDAWSAINGRDATAVRRLNPAFAGGRISSADSGSRILAPTVMVPTAVAPTAMVQTAMVQTVMAPTATVPAPAATTMVALTAPAAPAVILTAMALPVDDPTSLQAQPSPPELAEPQAIAVNHPRVHTVVRGESPWSIAHHYGIQVTELLTRNGLAMRSVLRPGMVLKLDADVIK